MSLKPSLKKFICFIAVLANLLILVNTSLAAEITYQYDALGRLTFVNDSVSGNKDYDYDEAGNRLKVSVGSSDDLASEPGVEAPPSMPTGLACWRYWGGAFKAQWYSVSGADHYIVRFAKEYKTSNTNIIVTSSSCKYRVKACSSTNVCSSFAIY